MTGLMPPWPLFSAFLAASVILALIPGPAVLYIVTRSVVQGRRHGVASVAGVALGNLGNALAAAVGLAALFAISSMAFSIVKYAGAAYLVWLGIQMIRATGTGEPAAIPRDDSLRRVFRDGFVVALLNPKTTMFFAAFLPQFLDPARSAIGQTLVLGSLFVVVAAISDSLYVLAASAVAPALRRHSAARHARRLGGGLFIALGLFTALSGARSGANR